MGVHGAHMARNPGQKLCQGEGIPLQTWMTLSPCLAMFSGHYWHQKGLWGALLKCAEGHHKKLQWHLIFPGGKDHSQSWVLFASAIPSVPPFTTTACADKSSSHGASALVSEVAFH